MQKGCLPAGCKVVICDDLLATGGTLGAACHLSSLIGVHTLAAIVVIELEVLAGARAIPVPVYSFIKR
jgi:adenine phosphoribosyltransferase